MKFKKEKLRNERYFEKQTELVEMQIKLHD
jgi:hypothetical protein